MSGTVRDPKDGVAHEIPAPPSWSSPSNYNHTLILLPAFIYPQHPPSESFIWVFLELWNFHGRWLNPTMNTF